MADTETPEEMRRWRVNKIRDVLARAGLPTYDRDFLATSPLADPVLRAGFIVSSRKQDPDCVYAEWIDHYFGRSGNWCQGCERITQALTAEGYAVELMTEPSLNGCIRVTRPDQEVDRG